VCAAVRHRVARRSEERQERSEERQDVTRGLTPWRSSPPVRERPLCCSTTTWVRCWRWEQPTRWGSRSRLTSASGLGRLAAVPVHLPAAVRHESRRPRLRSPCGAATVRHHRGGRSRRPPRPDPTDRAEGHHGSAGKRETLRSRRTVARRRRGGPVSQVLNGSRASTRSPRPRPRSSGRR
jgi:hypothetical protein